MNKQQLFNIYCKAMRLFNIAPLPPLIIWEPTLACNFRCTFCGFYGPGGAKPDIKKEMTVDEQLNMWSNIINSYKLYKPHVGITGGEPLLKHLTPILRLFKENGISWSLTTNGYLLGDCIKVLKAYNCDEVRVSLHGPEEIHDKTVGIKGAFSKVTTNLITAHNAGIPTLINCVITDENVGCLEQMKVIASLCSAQIRFQHLEFLTPEMKKSHKKFTEEHFGKDLPVKYGTTRLSKPSMRKVAEFVADNRKLSYEPNLKVVRWIPSDIYSAWKSKRYDVPADNKVSNYYTTFKPLSKYCFQPWGTARIDPYGNVYPCIDYYFGNLKYNAFFKTVWRGEKANKFRKLLKEKKLFPGCMRCCKL
jgi:MoaA/NifB/PqqE/SkfB family radical SAM enzyme